MARRPRQNSDAQAARGASLHELEHLLGHNFKRPELLELALTHRSFIYDTAPETRQPDPANPAHDNEQLEFVGDAALGLLAAEALCRRYPACREGELTRLRAAVVSRKHLGLVGARLDLGRWLRLGHTAEQNAGRTNVALFSNAVEALIAALYLDGGIEVARRFVETHVLAGALPTPEQSAGSHLNHAVGDYKSALQERLQAQRLGRPQYRLVGESGPDHQRVFTVEVHLEAAGDPQQTSANLAVASGTTKKQAQQEAARLALRILQQEEARHG